MLKRFKNIKNVLQIPLILEGIATRLPQTLDMRGAGK